MVRVTEEQRSATRKKLLEAAAEEFAAHGLRGANINRVSLAAGFAKGTVYNYFSSKDALFSAVVTEACALAARGLDDAPEGATTEQRLAALLAGDVTWAKEHSAFARVLVRESLSGGPAVFALIMEAAQPYMTKVGEVLAEGVRRGDIRDDVAVLKLAAVFAGLGNLALSQHWATGGAWPTFEEIPPLVVDLFVNGARRSRGR